MITAYNRSSMERLLTMPLDVRLHDLLAQRIASLVTAGLIELTCFVVIDHETTEENILAEIGLSPLVDPSGNRWGSNAFVAWWEYISKDAGSGISEMIICVGDSGFAYHLVLLPDANPIFVALFDEFCS
jgi:hypothetical protein